MHKKLKEKLIKYFESLNIEVCTNTNARGHRGYFSGNKIEISKAIKMRNFVPTLLHEFSHYIHTKIEKNLLQTGGNINAIFNLSAENCDNEIEKTLQEELFKVTNFVDDGSLCNILNSHKEKLINKIDKLEHKIKKEYPDFRKSKSLKNQTHPDDSKVLLTYAKRETLQKEKRRICKCINKYQKYYTTPTELFARFIEGLYLDKEKVKDIAPKAYNRFFNLLEKGYYHELKNVFQIVNQLQF